MRLNIYGDEQHGEAHLVRKVVHSGNAATITRGIRFYLSSGEHLNDDPDHDDRSAVTFWIPRDDGRSQPGVLYRQFATALMALAFSERLDGNPPEPDFQEAVTGILAAVNRHFTAGMIGVECDPDSIIRDPNAEQYLADYHLDQQTKGHDQ